jgi:hypothetical protein
MPLSPTLVFNLPSGSVSCRFTVAAAQQLQSRLDEMINAIATPTPNQSDIEYQYTGDIFLEIFCNPKIWPTPFAAKVLITLRDDRIRVSVESELTQTIADVQQFLDQYS